MPRKFRREKLRRRDEAIRPSVLVWLGTGDEGVLRADNPWLIMSVTAPAGLEARRRWQAGDEAGARELLARCPAPHQLFTGRNR